MSIVVSGHQTTAAFMKETTFNVSPFPSGSAIYPGFATLSLAGKNTPVVRPNGRQRKGVSLSPAGPFDVSGGFDPNPDPDTLFPILAAAFGAQGTPVAAVSYNTALTAPSVVSANTVLAVTAGTGSNALLTGSAALIVGWNTANQEICTVTAQSANTITVSATTKTHASGDPVILTSSIAFSSLLSYGATLPSFTVQFNRGASGTGDAVDFTGLVIDSLKLSAKPGALLAASFTIKGTSVAINAAPGVPAYSTAFPLHTDSALGGASIASNNGVGVLTGMNAVTVNGNPLPVGTIVSGWDLSLANNVVGLRGVNSRFISAFVPGQRKATGTIKMTFADNAVYKLFLGSATATNPLSSIGGVSITLPIASQTMADPAKGVPYSLCAVLPNCFPTDDPVPGVQYGQLEQTFTFEAAETAGNGDDLRLAIVSTAVAAY